MINKIKFRAWDRLENKMVYFGLYSLLVDGYEKDQYWEKQYKNGMKDLDIMLYTDRVDRDGSLIAESDLVSGESEYGDRDCEPVFFHEGSWYVGSKNDRTALWALQNIRIVGNGYE